MLASLSNAFANYAALQLEELSRLSDDPAPDVTRVLFTQNDVLARRSSAHLQSLALIAAATLQAALYKTGMSRCREVQ